MSACTIPECAKRATARGWCPMHYRRWRMHGDPMLGARPIRQTACGIPGCEKRNKITNGLCRMHDMRRARHGDPFTALNIVGNDEARFLSKTQRQPNGCTWWTGATRYGYGVMRIDGKRSVLTHRWAYERFVGPITAGLTIDHTCHNIDPTCPGGDACMHRRCLELEHLEAVTQRENNRRARARVRLTEMGGTQ